MMKRLGRILQSHAMMWRYQYGLPVPTIPRKDHAKAFRQRHQNVHFIIPQNLYNVFLNDAAKSCKRNNRLAL